MNYIGSKQRLLPFLEENILANISKPLSESCFCDLFAGTGAVSVFFENKVKSLIANDLEYYSYILNYAHLKTISAALEREHIEELNNLEGEASFFFEQYVEGGKAQRMYFSQANGKRIEAIRKRLTIWLETKHISQDTYIRLLASLLQSSDKVANTASVYGAFLKKIKKTAAEPFVLRGLTYEAKNYQLNEVFQADANVLINQIEGDILYLDPPYNARQYGANYHILNTLAQYKSFVPKGVTGLPEYNKSAYCAKGQVKSSFEELMRLAKFKHIFLSYNNEGLMPHADILQIARKYGRAELVTKNHTRFKADKTENRNHIANSTEEFLFVIEKKG